MPRPSRPLLALLLVASAWICQAGTSPTVAAKPELARLFPAPTQSPGILVAFHENQGHDNRLRTLRRSGLAIEAPRASSAFVRLRLPDAISEDRASALLTRLRRDPAVRLVEPDWPVTALAAPNDTFFETQYALQNTGQNGGTSDADIDAEEAWDILTGSDSLRVAVADTGADLGHPDLDENLGRDTQGNFMGIDLINNDLVAQDDHGHGTHVTGIVGARGNNGQGVSGVCQRVVLVPIKCLGKNNQGTISSAVQAIDFAILNGCRVINASFGTPEDSQFLREAVNRARNAGVMVVAACGNDGRDNDSRPIYPASLTTSFQNVIAVASSNKNDRLDVGSNFGDVSVDLAAPGTSVFSTVPFGRFGFSTGTSMAAPHVTGTIALMLAREPSLTVGEIRTRLFANVDQIANLSGKVRTSGRLNTRAAVLNHAGQPGALASFTIHIPGEDEQAPSTIVTGGMDLTGTLRILGVAPAGGISVRLESIEPKGEEALLTFPDEVIVPEGKSTVSFTIGTRPVPLAVDVEVRAEAGNIRRSVSLHIAAPELRDLTPFPQTVTNGGPVTFRLRLTGVAFEPGATVSLSSSNEKVLKTPATVLIPTGQTETLVDLNAKRTKKPIVVRLTAEFRGRTESTNVIVTPPLLKSLSFKPKEVTGPAQTQGKVLLAFKAPPGGVVVALSSASPNLVGVPSSVSVQAGTRVARFAANVGLTGVNQQVEVRASQGGITKIALLTLRPP